MECGAQSWKPADCEFSKVPVLGEKRYFFVWMIFSLCCLERELWDNIHGTIFFKHFLFEGSTLVSQYPFIEYLLCTKTGLRTSLGGKKIG